MKTKRIDLPRNWQDLEAHVFAQAVDFGAGIDIDDLASHMINNGFDAHEPIIVYSGKILDGRHRLEAAKKSTVTPVFREFVGTDGDAIQFVLKKAHRQHLNAGQRANLISDLLDKSRINAGSPSKTQAEIAKLASVSERTAHATEKIRQKGSPALQRAVRTGEVSVVDAEKVVKAPHKAQDKALEDFRHGKRGTLAKCLPPQRKPPAPKKQLTDKTGRELPDSCRDAFADAALPEFIATIEQAVAYTRADAWVKQAAKLAPHYPFILIQKFDEHIHEALHRMQLALETIKAGEPYAVCLRCNGEPNPNKVCSGCRGAGHVPEHRYAELKEQSA